MSLNDLLCHVGVILGFGDQVSRVIRIFGSEFQPRQFQKTVGGAEQVRENVQRVGLTLT